jgi:diguanylate cyclase (GGDEF)-like protein
MLTLVILLLFGYIGFVYYMMYSMLSFHKEKAEMEVFKVRGSYQKYLLQHDHVLMEKRILETKFRELFTLYDMTKEAAKSFSNEEALEIFRHKLKENVAHEECDFYSPLSKDVLKIKKDDSYFVFPLKGKGGMLGYIAIKGADKEDHDKISILTNQFTLILRRIHLYKEVERLAITDSLTQVFTRRYIMERFSEELQRARQNNTGLSFLMVDVDFFKQVNDRHGHLVGDSVLRAVAVCIMENVREIDIVGRYGGEEFCMVLPDTDAVGALYVAARVRKAVEAKKITAYDARLKTTVSIGISSFPRDGKKMATLIDKADWALYRAKKNGRNQVCHFGMEDE